MTYLKCTRHFGEVQHFPLGSPQTLGHPINAMVILPSIYRARYTRALSHKETGLGFSVEQRLLPLYFRNYYELFTHSQTSEIKAHVRQTDSVLCNCFGQLSQASTGDVSYMVYPFVNQEHGVKPSENDQEDSQVKRTKEDILAFMESKSLTEQSESNCHLPRFQERQTTNRQEKTRKEKQITGQRY